MAMDEKLYSSLVKVADALKDRDVKNMIKLAPVINPSTHLSTAENPRDFLFSLAKRKLITAEDSSFLKDMLVRVGKKDLCNKLPGIERTSESEDFDSLSQNLKIKDPTVKPGILRNELSKKDSSKKRDLREADLEENGNLEDAMNTEQDGPTDDNPGNNGVSGSKRYKMNAEPRGLCLIIDVEQFTEASNLERREGSSVDREHLKNTFKDLKFKVECLSNPTDDKIREELECLSRQEMSRYDCLVLCILSHGENGYFYGSNGRKILEEELIHYFCAKTCPSLRDKPKLMFLSYCRSNSSDPAANNKPTKQAHSDDEHCSVDFQFIYATLPGNVSYRSDIRGTFFIEALTQVLKENPEREFQHILLEVNRRVSERSQKGCIDNSIRRQSPSTQHSLQKKLYFKDPMGNGSDDTETRPEIQMPLPLPSTSQSNESGPNIPDQTLPVAVQVRMAGAKKTIEHLAKVTNLPIEDVMSCFQSLKRSHSEVTNFMLMEALCNVTQPTVLEDDIETNE